MGCQESVDLITLLLSAAPRDSGGVRYKALGELSASMLATAAVRLWTPSFS